MLIHHISLSSVLLWLFTYLDAIFPGFNEPLLLVFTWAATPSSVPLYLAMFLFFRSGLGKGPLTLLDFILVLFPLSIHQPSLHSLAYSRGFLAV